VAKPGEIKYDFTKQDKDKEFKRFLRKKPRCGSAEGIDMKKFKKGMDMYCEKFLKK
jgi:hypothetical protein